ncbi:MAG TPA: protease modulator HflC [Alphaproteobacteria bacterium]|jgi:membrane protease subunit HflC|nr:protease modulator HflC [Alphaproteobacteria bacterium]
MKTNTLAVTAVAVLALVLLALATSLFTVNQTQQALVLQFGELKRVIKEPGLKLKVPLMQNVVYIDNRVLDLDPPAEEVIASDQKRIVVDAVARYRINDPLKFLQTVGNESGLQARLSRIVNGSLRNVIGNYTLLDVLSEKRAAIMSEIRDQVNGEVSGFGVSVIDVRLRRADLPQANSDAIFQRMRSERDREAKQARAEGAEIAQRIRARAERERTVITAEAQKTSQIVRGEGDAQSVKIYADAFGRDPQFFAFYRSMEAYRKALGGDNTTMVLAPDSEFFRFFNLSEPNADPRPAQRR